jgi:DNA-binding PadR family transcriptional regulator
MRNLTHHQRAILEYLDSRGSDTPTEIGIHAGGKNYNQASCWACPKLRELERAGLVERDGPRKPYRLTVAGRRALDAARIRDLGEKR